MRRWCLNNVINKVGEKTMQRLSIAILFGLSACATVPSSDEVSIRAASWHGAPAHELIAILGEPKISKKGNMTWRFLGLHETQVSYRSNRSVNTGSLSVLTGCASCSTVGSDGSVVTPGTSVGSSSRYTTGPRFCTYVAHIENGIVSKLTTHSNSRTRCLFEELPLRSTE